MANCYDHNHTPIHVGDWVTYFDPQSGHEKEGSIINCQENNIITIDAESGKITTNATNTFVQP